MVLKEIIYLTTYNGPSITRTWEEVILPCPTINVGLGLGLFRRQ